jgi:MFS superfamily sulfate permease-like transporter
MKSPISLPKAKDLRGDLAAGLTNGLVQIPDAMASAILALVKPVNGLNTLVIGTPVGALFAGSVFMTVATTGAISLAVADALGRAASSQRVLVLIVLTLLVDVIQLALGLLKPAVIGLASVALVGDIASIPSSLPQFTMPDLSYLPRLIVPAIAIAAIGLVQGAGADRGGQHLPGQEPGCRSTEEALGAGRRRLTPDAEA